MVLICHRLGAFILKQVHYCWQITDFTLIMIGSPYRKRLKPEVWLGAGLHIRHFVSRRAPRRVQCGHTLRKITPHTSNCAKNHLETGLGASYRRFEALSGYIPPIAYFVILSFVWRFYHCMRRKRRESR